METQTDTCLATFTAALFALAERWKQHKGPSTNEWVNKMGYIYINGKFLIIERNPNTHYNMAKPGKRYAK